MTKIPYGQLQTLFLDAGGTIVAIRYDWVCAELSKLGIICDGQTLQRAEAAARPLISAQLQEFQKQRGNGASELFLTIVFKQLPADVIADESQSTELAQKLVPILFPGGKASYLWSYVLPGVREALKRFRAMGLQLVLVSNADGTVEQSFENLELRSFFDVVVDSHVVKVEKPDPRIFQLALEYSGANPEYTLHVGDIYHIDIVGARSVGLHALLLDPYSDWPDVDCERAPDLLALSEKIAEMKTD